MPFDQLKRREFITWRRGSVDRRFDCEGDGRLGETRRKRAMKTLAGLSLLAALIFATPADAQTVVLRGARVIDGTGAAPLDNATVVIRDGRIVTIGPSTSASAPSGAEVVDYSGKTIIPGLISAHSHVGIFVGLTASAENYNRASKIGRA